MSNQSKATPLSLVKSQAEDEGLWFIVATCSEAYLQQGLRELHAAVEADDTAAERDALKAEVAKLREALAELTDLYAKPGESNVDRFERVAEMFRRETGCMAPGKDVSVASGDSMTHEERRDRWEAWYTARAEKARLALTGSHPQGES